MTDFIYDPRLAADTFAVLALPLCDVRLMNDARWPWLILVPRIADASEVHDLSDATQIQLAQETALVARALKDVTNCEKINSAAIGNIVRQLHVHVIARSQDDGNWPGPVWGFGAKVLYDPAAVAGRIKALKMRIESAV